MVTALDILEVFFFFFFIFKLYIIVLVLPNIKMNPPQVNMCSPSWTLLSPLNIWNKVIFWKGRLLSVYLKMQPNFYLRIGLYL